MKKLIAILILILITVLQPLPAFAHSGRTDKNGGHYNRQTGEYHYHNGGGGSKSSGSSSSNKTPSKPTVKIKRPSNKIYAGSRTKLKCTISNSNDSVEWTSSNDDVATVLKDGTLVAIKNGKTTITAELTSGETDSFEIEILEIMAEDITINTPPTELEIGKTHKMQCTITPADTTNKDVAWKSNNPEILKINSNGEITAVSKGRATITATTSNEKITSCEISIFEIEVEDVKINTLSTNYKVGDTLNIEVLITPNNATVKDYDISYSDNTKISTVGGVTTLMDQGEITITATAKNGKESSINLNVVQPVSEITTTEEDINLYIDEEFQLVYEVLPANATVRDVIFSSNDGGIVSVDSNGKITARKAGTTTVEIKGENEVVKIVSITVSSKVVEGFSNVMAGLFCFALFIFVVGGIGTVFYFFVIRKKKTTNFNNL